MKNTRAKGGTDAVGNVYSDGEDLLCSGVTCDGSPKVSISCPLVSPSTAINMPQGLHSIDVATTFEVPLTTVSHLQKLINDIEAGKHDELLSGMTNDDRMETMDALGTICISIQADNNNDDVTPCKVLHVDRAVDESTIPSDPIVQSVDITTKSTSYVGAAGASAKDQPKVSSNFRTFVADPVFDGVNISILRKVVEKAGLEAVLDGGPWLIRKSPIILKKWSMDTRLLKKELIHILIWVKLHDVPIQVLKEDGISLIATFIGKLVMLDSYISSVYNESWGRSSFARCLIEVNSEADLVDIVTISIPSLSEDGFTKETIRVEYECRPSRCDICKIFCHVHGHCLKKVVSPPIVTTPNVVTPTVEKTNDGFQTVGKKKKRKGKSKSTNSGQFVRPSVKLNVRYEPKATTSALKKGVTNVEKDDEEDVQHMYDESANLIQNTKTGGSSSFTPAAVLGMEKKNIEALLRVSLRIANLCDTKKCRLDTLKKSALLTLKSVSKRYGRKEHFILPIQVSIARVDVSTAKCCQVTLILPVNVAITKVSAARKELLLLVSSDWFKGKLIDSDSFKWIKGYYFWDYLKQLITERIVYHLFDGEVELLGEIITSQLQGKLWLYDEVRTRLCLFCHHQIGEDCWDS
ncbi:zinc knuckle CX2CX4HX4C containing protein [Tanacetum coccineum]